MTVSTSIKPAGEKKGGWGGAVGEEIKLSKKRISEVKRKSQIWSNWQNYRKCPILWKSERQEKQKGDKGDSLLAITG